MCLWFWAMSLVSMGFSFLLFFMKVCFLWFLLLMSPVLFFGCRFCLMWRLDFNCCVSNHARDFYVVDVCVFGFRRSI